MNKIVTSFIFLIFFFISAYSEECHIMLGDDVDPEEFSESTGKKFFSAAVHASKHLMELQPITSKRCLLLLRNSQMPRKRNLVSIRLNYLSKESALFIPKDHQSKLQDSRV